jgi:hypothetical protein
MTDRRPGIGEIGKVRDNGTTATAYGWGIGQCAARCTCHRDLDGRLKLYEGRDGSLGLVSYRADCDCCQPWSVEELRSIIAELAQIQAAPEVSR